jgi:benzoyl-CoA reductase subunit A
MRCFVGIDLGSTTTKAVILDEEGRLVGRGLTNSRSDYTVAARVAKEEALVNARFEILRGILAETAGARADDLFLGLLKSRFRHEQILEQLGRLREACLEEAGRKKYAGREEGIRDALGALFARMAEEIAAKASEYGADESQFFRDIASSHYLEAAQDTARASGLSFDLLVGIFDKSILQVENHVVEQSFRSSLLAALDALEIAGDGDSGASEIRTAAEHAADVRLEEIGTVGTGYGRLTLPFKKEEIRSEILCHGLGAHFMFPGTRTVLDIGGQDMKAIQVDENGIVGSFQMNDRCAAGTGRYLGYIADELNLALHQLGPLASESDRPLRISSTCTVFAGTEFREKLALGHRREDILAGLHRAIILRAMSLLARSGGVHQEFTFTGGVAKNGAAVRELRQLVAEHYGDGITLNIHPDSIYTGAVGAALFARRKATRTAPEAIAG